MASRKRSPAATKSEALDTLTLRLRQNAFVNSVFTPGGTEVVFPRAEAERRLARTQLWDIA